MEDYKSIIDVARSSSIKFSGPIPNHTYNSHIQPIMQRSTGATLILQHQRILQIHMGATMIL
ncbi:hypothetical protein HanIR_Chr14g0718831 [Helianthus annuus]|nr:hypothetical protein HanIR_Chr14g0718831 [Helianthus annuus]